MLSLPAAYYSNTNYKWREEGGYVKQTEHKTNKLYSIDQRFLPLLFLLILESAEAFEFARECSLELSSY